VGARLNGLDDAYNKN